MSDDFIRSLALERRELSWLALVSVVGGSAMMVAGLRLGPLAVALGLFLWLGSCIIVLATWWATRNYPHHFLAHGATSTDRLLIRPIDLSAIPDFVQFIDADFIRRHHWSETTAAAMRLLPESPLWRVATAGIGLLYRVDPTNAGVPNHTGDDTSPTPIGFLSVNQSPVNGSRWMIGAHLRSENRGEGYMTEALTAVLPLIAAGGIHEVHLACERGNTAMIRVATKVGMTRLPDVAQWRHDIGYTTPAALFVWSAGGPTATSAAKGAPTQRTHPG